MLNLDHAISQRSRRFMLSLALFALASSVALSFYSSTAPAASPESHRESQSSTRGTRQSRVRLTMEDRIAYQRAIEEVYWRHRIWPKENPKPPPALDRVVPPSVLRAKVEDYLHKSRALAVDRQRPITEEDLQAEIKRMARHTKQPEMLRELWAALGNDPHVIAECLARPALAEALISQSYAQENHPRESKGRVRQMSGEYGNLEWARGEKRDGPAPKDSAGEDGSYLTASFNPERDKLATAEWRTEPFGFRAMEGGKTGEVNEPKYGYQLEPLASASGGCVDDTWTPTSTTNAPSARADHKAVWTGAEMIVWGGGQLINTGGRYDPATDSWKPTSAINAPSARWSTTAVWTGTEMIVWGGSNLGELNTGGRYNPATDSWMPTSTTNAPSARYGHTAVWTGTEMIVWGGTNPAFPEDGTSTGGRYDPATDSWKPTSMTRVAGPRLDHTAVWTGTQMIVWGGMEYLTYLNTGGRYDPVTADSRPPYTSSITARSPQLPQSRSSIRREPRFHCPPTSSRRQARSQSLRVEW
jgi:hypothetical protein